MKIYELKIWVFTLGVMGGTYLVLGLYQSLGLWPLP